MSTQPFVDILAKNDIPVSSVCTVATLPEGPLYALSVPGVRAFDAWSRLKSVAANTGHVRESVALALVPTADPAAVPALLRFGSWNSCPPPEVHVAAFRQWGLQFGAEPVAITGDTVEFFVNAPPTDRVSAEALARVQYVYCTDIVDQGCETIEVLAATLLNDPRWFFWWD